WAAANPDNPVWKESDWHEFDEWPAGIRIKNQNGRGACNGHASALALELARHVAGMPHVPLSAWFIYAVLCNGLDTGSSILAALDFWPGRGTAPESDAD